jgi:hypothetical protein
LVGWIPDLILYRMLLDITVSLKQIDRARKRCNKHLILITLFYLLNIAKYDNIQNTYQQLLSFLWKMSTLEKHLVSICLKEYSSIKLNSLSLSFTEHVCKLICHKPNHISKPLLQKIILLTWHLTALPSWSYIQITIS